MQKLGERIRQVRGRLSQEAFAATLGISKGALGGYERGENCPNVEVVLAICRLCHVEISWLLTGQTGKAQECGMNTSPPCHATDVNTGENRNALVQNHDRQGGRENDFSGRKYSSISSSTQYQAHTLHAKNQASLPQDMADQDGRQCQHCSWLQEQLVQLEEERRDLNRENRSLWQKNADLSVRLARLEQRMEGSPERGVSGISPGYVPRRGGLREEPQSSGNPRRIVF